MQSAKCKVAADRGPDQFAICILHFYLCLRLAAAASDSRVWRSALTVASRRRAPDCRIPIPGFPASPLVGLEEQRFERRLGRGQFGAQLADGAEGMQPPPVHDADAVGELLDDPQRIG